MGRFSFLGWVCGYWRGVSSPESHCIETKNVIDVNGIVIDVIFCRQSKEICHNAYLLRYSRLSNGASEKNGGSKAA
jgi:hypothetical protein